MVRAGELFDELEKEGKVMLYGDRQSEISGLAMDSRNVKPGDLFVALSGRNFDGHSFLRAAAVAGSSAFLVEKGSSLSAGVTEPGVVVEADSVRGVVGRVAARYYGDPSAALDVIGITGTNGKTSVTYLVESIFAEAGVKPGVIGTVDYRWGDRSEKPSGTTPEAVDLQKVLRAMADDGVETVIMEVSSHSLAWKRIEGCRVGVAVFTNLGRDHLDYHLTLEDYFLAKSALFCEHAPSTSIVNRDDPWGERLIGMIPGRVVTYGLKGKGDFTALSLNEDASGLRFQVSGMGQKYDIRSSLLGRHNAYNIVTAVAVAAVHGISRDEIEKGIRAVDIIPGRFENVSGIRSLPVLVDYAHTPDALENALGAARAVTKGRLIVVFGCGGERDRGKRPLMGAVAARLADVTFITSDNPRGEEPSAIIGEIEEGFVREGSGGSSLTVIADRGSAIRAAVNAAAPGDIVLIAGKGHEDYQILADRTDSFSDHEEARAALAEAGT